MTTSLTIPLPFSGSSKKESPKGSQKLFNINGVLYKSSRSQLFKSPVKAANSSPSGNALYIRGEKFLVTGNGNRLQRAPESPAISEPRKRLDIGGVTFVANDKGGFERTNSHMVRSYLRCVELRWELSVSHYKFYYFPFQSRKAAQSQHSNAAVPEEQHPVHDLPQTGQMSQP